MPGRFRRVTCQFHSQRHRFHRRVYDLIVLPQYVPAQATAKKNEWLNIDLFRSELQYKPAISCPCSAKSLTLDHVRCAIANHNASSFNNCPPCRPVSAETIRQSGTASCAAASTRFVKCSLDYQSWSATRRIIKTQTASSATALPLAVQSTFTSATAARICIHVRPTQCSMLWWHQSLRTTFLRGSSLPKSSTQPYVCKWRSPEETFD